MDEKSSVFRWSSGLTKTAAGRPPSIPDLHRRSGSIPGEPYPPSKQIDCTAVAVSSKAKKHPFWKTKAVNPRGFGGRRPPSRGGLPPFGVVREQIRGRLIAECLVGPLIVGKMEVVLQRREQILAGGKVAGVNQFVLDRAPQPLDENVVQCAASAIQPWVQKALLHSVLRLSGAFRIHFESTVHRGLRRV